MKASLFLKTVLCAAIIVFGVSGAFAQSANKKARLFNLIGMEKFGDKSLSVAAVNQQEIEVNFAAIGSPRAREIQIADLDGNVYSAVQRETEGFVRKDADTFTWNGKIYGSKDFDGDVVLTVHKNVLSGLIFAPSGVYNITPQAGGAHVLVKVDQSLFPEEHPQDYFDWQRENAVQMSSSGDRNLFWKNSAAESLAPSADDGSTIDVMIVYTTNVKNGLGGTTQADAFAAQAVATTNAAYLNSGITLRVRLAHSMEVNFTETGTLSAALTWVRTDATVATARDAYRADAVAIFVQTASDGCGLGYVMSSGGNTNAFAPYAFTATVKSCAVDNLSFPHELGHNQGSNHNPANAGMSSTQSVFTYSFGHCVNSGVNPFRTVLSYAGTECGSTTPRRAYFSNPSVNYMSQPTGTSDRNNALTINSTALAFSQFRDSLAPTAASVTAGGRVSAAKGRGVSGAVVSVTGGDGIAQTTRTNQFGYYSFVNLPAGRTYVIDARHKRYQFTPQAVSLVENLSELNFTALQ
jgi:hypothetical protein